MIISYLPHEFSQQRQQQKPVWIYPVLMAMEATYNRERGGNLVFWDKKNIAADKFVINPEGIPFLDLPIPDRTFTNAFDKKYQKYGNYKYNPATHMQVADGCTWGKCSFCVENKKEYQIRPMGQIMEEIDICHHMGFKEIFDDSGTFPDGDWMDRFCTKMLRKPYKITLGCNMRIDGRVDYKLMKDAGFRMVLFGVESANQITLDKINKGVKVENIIPTIKSASEAGLDCHVAVMFGYPWEEDSDSRRTLALVHSLLKAGYAKTAQASVFRVKGIQSKEESQKYVNKLYNVAFTPEFWKNKLRSIRQPEDATFLIKQIKKGLIRD